MKKFLIILIILSLILTLFPYFKLGYSKTSVANVLYVQLTPNIVGELVRIDIKFTLTSQIFANSDNIVVTFPKDIGGNSSKEFTIPSIIPKTAVLINGSNNITDVQVDLLNRKVAVITSINLQAANEHVLTFLTTSGIKNPTKSGFYSLKFNTSQETTPATSPSFYIYPGPFDHVKIIPSPAFFTSNRYAVGPTSEFYLARYGSSGIMDLIPSDMYGNTLFEGYTYTFGNFVRPEDKDCGYETYDIPTARWFRVNDAGTPAVWNWGTFFGTGNCIYLMHPASVGPDDTTLFIHPLYNKNLSDFILETKIAFDNSTGYHGGVKFRFNDYLTRSNTKANGYYVDIWGPNIRLLKTVNGVETLITSSPLPAAIASNRWYTLKIVASGSNIQVFWQDPSLPITTTPIINATDTTFTSGIFGVWQYGGDATQRRTAWDDFYIKSLAGSTLFSDNFETKIAAPNDPPNGGVDANFRYCDSNRNGVYDCMDCVYLDLDNSFSVTRGDIRITATTCGGSYGPGSIVKLGDSDIGISLRTLNVFLNPSTVSAGDEDIGGPALDIGTSLIKFAAEEKHAENINSNNLFDPGEWIYEDLTILDLVSPGDRRLTTVTIGPVTYPANSIVNYPFVKHTENISINTLYDPGENIYMDNDNNNQVSIGDTRLTNVTDVGPYLAGTTVSAGEGDIGRALILFNFQTLTPEKFVDANGNLIYSIGEWIYRDNDNNKVVSPLDTRLTSVTIGVTTYPAGSTVSLGDLDLGRALIPFGDLDLGEPLTSFGANERHAENVASDTKYNPGEWIYREDVDSPNSVTNNDIRLTSVTIGVTTYIAGSTVISGFTLSNFAANERFYDYDFTATFTTEDWIYRDIDNSNTVTSGDRRLSNVTIGNKSYPAGSTVLASDTDVGLVLNTIDSSPPAPIFRYVDSDNSGNYSPFERIYNDVNESGTIDVGDIRIRTPSLRFYNTDTSKDKGLDSCDFVYLDLDNSMTPSECDIRLTPVNIWTKNTFAHYEAGSKVKITDLDASKLDPLQVIWPFMMLKQYSNPSNRLFFDYHFGDYNSNKVWDDNEPVNFVIDFVWNYKLINGIQKYVVSPGDLRISTNFLINSSLVGINPGVVDINGFYTAPVMGSADPPYEVTLNVILTVGGISRTGSSKIVLFRGPPKVTLSPQTQWLTPCTEYQYKALVTDVSGNPIPYAENNVNFGVGYPKNTTTNNYLMPYSFGFTGTYPEDLGMQLVEFSVFEKHADNVLINVPANNGKYDPGEWIYRDNDLSNSVSPGDLRLTKVYKAGKTYAPGTIVQLGDWDTGTSLIGFNNLKERHTQHINANSPFPPAYDVGEYIYSDEDSNFIVSYGDIRLSDVKRGSVFYAAGTKVNDKDIGDVLRQFSDDAPAGVDVKDVKFVDLNGNGVFDNGYWFQSNNDWYYFPGEWLYIDIDNNGLVNQGDYRIISCSCLLNCSICGPMGLTPGYVLATDHDQGYALKVDTNIDEKIKFVDRNSNGSWDYLTEPLYWDKNGDSYVTKDDIRISDVSTPGATIDKTGKFTSSSCAGGEYSIWASFTYNSTCVDGTCGGAVVYNSIPTYAIVTTAVRVEVSPRNITLISGERVQFTAVALDPLDHVVITPKPVWSLLNMDPMYPIGTIDSSTGLFTASSDRCVEGYAIATIHTTCCGDISSTLPPPEEGRTSAKIKINGLVDVLEQTITFTGAEISATLKWFVDQSGDKLKVTITTSIGTSKELYFTPPTASVGTWQNIFVSVPITELGITTIGTTVSVTIRGDVILSYPSTKWCTFDLYTFNFTTTPLLTINGDIFTIGASVSGTLTSLSDLNNDGRLDPLPFIKIVLSGPYTEDLTLEPWGSTSVVDVQTDLNGKFNLGTGWVDSLGYHGAKYDGIYKIEALSSPPSYKYIYLKYKDTITTNLANLTVDLNNLQIIEGTLQLPNNLTPGNNDVYVELWKVDPVKGYERINISSGPINEIARPNLPPQTYAPVKLGANGYFKIYAIIDELGSYALFTRVGNEKSSLGDYLYGRYYDQFGTPTPYRPFSIAAPNYKATLLVEPTVLYANKLNYFTIFVTDPSGNPIDELSLNLRNKFTFELPPGWTLQNRMVKPITKGTYLISGTPVGTGSGSMVVKVAGAVLLSLPIQPLSLYNPYAYIDLTSVRLDREMIPPVVGEEYVLVFGFHQPPTPGFVVFDPAKAFEIDKDDTIFVEEISRSDTEIKLKFIPTMYTELPVNLKFGLRGVDNRSDEENGRVSDSEIKFKLFGKFQNILGFKIKVETTPQEIIQGSVGAVRITVLDMNDVPRNNAWVEIWGYNKDGSPVSDMFNVGGSTPKIIIDASHLDPLNQNILNGIYTQLNIGFNHASDPEKDRVPFEVRRYTLVKVYTGDPSIPTSKIMGYIPYAFVIKPKKALNISLLSIDGMTTYNKILAGRRHQLLINAPGVPAGSEIIAIGSKGSTFVNNMNGTFTLTLGEPYLEEGNARIVAIGPNRDTYGDIDVPIVKPKLVITPSDNILSAEINETITFSLFDPITNAPFYAKEVGADGKVDSNGAPFGFRTVIMNKVSVSGVSSGKLTVNGRDNKNPTLPDSPKVILYYTTNDTPVGKFVVLNEFDLISVKVTVEISTPQGTIIDKAIVNKPNRIKITVVDAHNSPVANAEVIIAFAYNYALTTYDLKLYTDNSGVASSPNFVPKYAGGYDIVVKKQDKEYVFYDYFYAREVTEDTTPPQILIIEPEDGSTSQKAKIEVIGKVSDDSKVTAVYVNGMRVDLLPDGTFMTYVTLDDGTNRIRVIAVDEFGNIGTKEIYVIYKTPTLTLIIDPIPSFVNTPIIKIKGSTDKGAIVYVNDEEIDVDSEGKFETPYTLIEGLNTIVIRSEKGMLTRTRRISVTLDTTPPKLQVTIPENVLERVFEVKGTTEVGATVTINDEPVLVNPDGSFSYVLTIPVGEKELRVIVKAQDKAGNTSTVSKTVKYRREIIIEMIIDSPVIKVTKDGVSTTVIYEIAPFTMPPGRTMVPLRFIAETFGARVDWDPKTEGIHIELKKSDGTMIIIDMQLRNKIAYVNGKPYVLDVAPFTVEPQGRTVVPIRFIAEAFGAKVDWDPVLQKVTITYYP